jgi:hypothetical protein
MIVSPSTATPWGNIVYVGSGELIFAVSSKMRGAAVAVVPASVVASAAIARALRVMGLSFPFCSGTVLLVV